MLDSEHDYAIPGIKGLLSWETQQFKTINLAMSLLLSARAPRSREWWVSEGHYMSVSAHTCVQRSDLHARSAWLPYFVILLLFQAGLRTCS